MGGTAAHVPIGRECRSLVRNKEPNAKAGNSG
jgi:hypothetical protein